MTAEPLARRRPDATGAPDEQTRAMLVAARLYHVHGVRQREIGERLVMSQAKVSRLLRAAEQAGHVRTVVAVPEGLDCDLEEELEARWGLQEVHVLGIPDDVVDLAPPLGRAAAAVLAESALAGGVIGITSWSRTLQEMARAVPDAPRAGTRYVVEMLGDLGSPTLQHRAARATQSLAAALGGEPVFLRTPGVVPTPAVREAVCRDAHVRRALALLDDMDVALVGVGPADVHGDLSPGDSWFTPEQLRQARRSGAVVQLDQRFLDAAGRPVVTPLDDLVVGATLAQVRAAGRRVLVAGGPAKHAAVRAALAGGWADVLVTDRVTAKVLRE